MRWEFELLFYVEQSLIIKCEITLGVKEGFPTTYFSLYTLPTNCSFRVVIKSNLLARLSF